MKRLFLSLFVIMAMNAMHYHPESDSEPPELSVLEVYNPTDTVVDLSDFESSPYHETTPLTSPAISNLVERMNEIEMRTSRFQLALLGINTGTFLLASYAIYSTWSPDE